MPVYRLNCVSESFFESMYFIRRLCMNIENFFGTNNQQKIDRFLIYERDLMNSKCQQTLIAYSDLSFRGFSINFV